MKTLTTTRMSSKGQVVIPEDMRERLRLDTGTQFVVMGENDVVILKVITPPSMDEFDGIINRARKQAKNAGMGKGDIALALRKVRGIKR